MADSSYFEDDESLNSWEQAEQRVVEAQELYETGLMQQALDKLKEAVSMNPGCASWHFNQGLTLDALERYEEAIECFRHALELSPEDVEIMNCLAVDYTRTVQYDLAITVFEKIETIDPAFEPAFCNRIIAYTEMELHDKAEQMFYIAQQINPECPICFYNIGNSLFTRGQYSRAIWCWEKTAQLEPTHPQINYRIAQACWADGQINRAKDYFLRELRRSPGNVEVLLDYGVFLMEQGHNQPAAEKFRWILELRPDFAPAAFYLGEVYRIQQDYDLSKGYYRNAILMDNALPGPRYRLAQILSSQQACDEITDLLKAELKISCEDEQIMLSIARMMIKQGEFEDALMCLLQVLDVNPQNADAYFVMSAVMMQRKDLEGCLQFLEHAIELEVKNRVAYTAAALIHCRHNNFLRAWQILDRAVSLLGNSWYLRGWRLKVAAYQAQQMLEDKFGHYLPSILVRKS